MPGAQPRRSNEDRSRIVRLLSSFWAIMLIVPKPYPSSG